MNILLACEESQAVATEARKHGHNAFSCDIIECSGGHPEWHIMQDVLPLLDGDCEFKTMDGQTHTIEGTWDMIIGFPPCTYLTNAGARHLWKGGVLNEERYQKGLEAKKFFMAILNANCPRVAVENPTPSKIYELPKPSQIIQPYQFGHKFTKRTQLWLKGLPLLVPTDLVEPERTWCPSGSYSGKHAEKHRGMFTKDRARNRSKTFPGIAKAMIEQWGNVENMGYWIESPNCDNICSKCGLGSETYELLNECPHCHAKMHTDFCYPSVDLYEEETGLKVWGDVADGKID